MEALPHAAVVIVAPSPHSPAKTGVNALMLGEGCSEVQHILLGEGFKSKSPPPSPIINC